MNQIKSHRCDDEIALQATWGRLHRENGTSQARHIFPSPAEREAAKAWNDHIDTCNVCQGR